MTFAPVMSNALVTLGVLTSILCAACGPGPRGEDDACDGVCSALGYQECVDGVLQPPVVCPPGQICAPDLGCTVCIPNDLYCDGNTIMRCNEDGTGGTPVEECTGDLVCSAGECKTPCEAVADQPSNLGCDFWSVDLDNERFNWIGGPVGGNDAAGQQYA